MAYKLYMGDGSNRYLKWDGADLVVGDAEWRYEDSPSTDEKGSGSVSLVNIDANSTGIGAALYMAADGHYEESVASPVGKLPCVALALESGTGADKKILHYGYIRQDSWNWSTAGGTVYVSPATVGALTEARPTTVGDFEQAVGYVIASNIIFFNPDSRYEEIIARVPSGLIVPYYDTDTPSGWSAFNDANGYFIIGAGDTYNVLATSLSSTLSGVLASEAAHSGSTQDLEEAIAAGGSYAKDGNYARGGWSHTFSTTYLPTYRSLRFIRSDSELTKFPNNGILLSDVDLTTKGLTQLFNADGRMLRANSASAVGGGGLPVAPTVAAAGAHHHGTGTDDEAGATGEVSLIAAGNHTHTASFTSITASLERVFLTAWTDTSENFNLEFNMIGMYQSTTGLPTGWQLCDGTNDTPDLRNYFIEFGTTTNHGASVGDNSVLLSWVTDTQSHAHGAGVEAGYTGDNFPHSDSVGHSHAQAVATPCSYFPPYYALAFIKYVGE